MSRTAFAILAATATAALAACAAGNGGEKETYRMQKGGMGSTAHTMERAVQTPAPARTPAETYRMQKGGMGSTSHTMER